MRSLKAAKDALKRRDDTNYGTFEDYKKVRSKVWIIEETEHDFFCNCFIGLKGKICKHSMGLLIKTKKVIVDDVVRSKPLGVNRKRGRPKKLPLAFAKTP